MALALTAACLLLVLAAACGDGGADGNPSPSGSRAATARSPSSTAAPTVSAAPSPTPEPTPAAIAQPTQPRAPAPTQAPTPASTPERVSLLTVVDKQTALPPGYVPPDLVKIGPGYIASGFSGSLRAEAYQALVQMLSDAYAAGNDIYVRSAYRSYSEQASTFAYWVSVLGEAEARRVSAEPGHSEHQLGTAVDLTDATVGFDLTESFGSSASGQLLMANAYRYGFALSYPAGAETVTGYAYEPWHWRYIGADAAAAFEGERADAGGVLAVGWAYRGDALTAIMLGMANTLAGFAEKLGSPSEALKRQQRMNDDLKVLLSHMDEWRAIHPNRWIAVYNRELAAAADTREGVITAIEAKGIPLADVILDLVSEQRVAYIL